MPTHRWREQADHSFVNFAEDDTSCESFYLQSLAARAVAHAPPRRVRRLRTASSASSATLPRLLLEVKRTFEAEGSRPGRALKDEPYHIITGAGSTWPEAFYYGMCILEEMQWIRTRPVHASDFFHGTLELVEDGRQRSRC